MRKPVTIESLEGRLLLTAAPNDPRYASEWGLSAVAASTAWNTTTGSAATVVADIDTGLDYAHDDLWENVWINPSEIPAAVKAKLKDSDGDKAITFYDLNAAANKGLVADVDKNGRIDASDLLSKAKYGGWADGADEGSNGYVDDIIGWDFADNDNDPLDHDGHGTHTAGTIGAMGNDGTGVTGVDWRVSLMAVKIFDDAGNAAGDSAIAAAIRYSAANGARVSNNSWGGGDYSTAIRDAIAYAGAKGQLFVVAAGNDSSNLDSAYYNDYPSEYQLDNVLVVGATTSSGGAAYYSNYGKANVDVFAPGSNVLSTYLNDRYVTMSGTSMATPHVTGAAALMLAANSTLTAAQLKARIIAGADQSASLASRSVSGGELNVAAAVAGTAGARYTAPAAQAATSYRVVFVRWHWFSVPADGATPVTPVTPPAATPVTPVVPPVSTPVASTPVVTTPATSLTIPPAAAKSLSTSDAARAAVTQAAAADAIAARPATQDGLTISATARVSGAVFSATRINSSPRGDGARFSRDLDVRTTTALDLSSPSGAPRAGTGSDSRVPDAPAQFADATTAADAPSAGDSAVTTPEMTASADGILGLGETAAAAQGDVAWAWTRHGAVAAAALAAVVSGAYAHVRRRREAAAATTAKGKTLAATGPVEFPLRRRR